jgi:zinc transport system substrate-binding protein
MKPTRNILILLVLSLAACGEQKATDNGDLIAERGRPVIVASNYPLYFFASELAGDSAEVILPDIEGGPANWKPGSADINLLQSADLIVLNGAGYESWLDWVTLPKGRLLDSSAGFADRLLPLREETVHQHGPAGEHSHEGLAFTVWLDPELAALQATAIEQAIARLAPENADHYRGRLAALQQRLAALDEEFLRAFGQVGGQPLVFSHPVYQYLEARYRLNGISVHWEPGEEPGTHAMLDFMESLRTHPAQLMVWEDEPLASSEEQLLQLGVRSVSFHTAANRGQNGDFFAVMEANIERLLLQCCSPTISIQ